jgi:hypothetical protein
VKFRKFEGCILSGILQICVNGDLRNDYGVFIMCKFGNGKKESGISSYVQINLTATL